MLTNRWAAQRDAAIVTHVPGTTRDILELSLDIGGLPILVADTAGLRDTTDEVEKIGIERARKAYVLSLTPFSLILLSGFHTVPLTTLCVSQGSSSRCFASRTRMSRHGHVHTNAVGPTARDSC